MTFLDFSLNVADVHGFLPSSTQAEKIFLQSNNAPMTYSPSPIYALHDRNRRKFNAEPQPFRHIVTVMDREGDIARGAYSAFTLDLFSYVSNRTATYDDGYRVAPSYILDITGSMPIRERDTYEEKVLIPDDRKLFLERMGEVVWKAVSAYTHLNGPFAMHAYDVLAVYMRLLTDKDEGLYWAKLLRCHPFTLPDNVQARKDIKSFFRDPPSKHVKRILMIRPDGSTREYDPSLVVASFSYSNVLHFEPSHQNDENHHKFAPQIGRMVAAGLDEHEVNDILRWVWGEQIYGIVNILQIIQLRHPGVRWTFDMTYLKFAHTSYVPRVEAFYLDQVPGRFAP